ncbi:hypothetical protein [Kamptonema formosum]|uniref:hypothetical protein n=1 Tax=Kamptonema formosum TaxID=331992 RepID=UPI000347E643|nr:hypothetical protein [Oscillatoria sp. PCC 10802]
MGFFVKHLSPPTRQKLVTRPNFPLPEETAPLVTVSTAESGFQPALPSPPPAF